MYNNCILDDNKSPHPDIHILEYAQKVEQIGNLSDQSIHSLDLFGHGFRK